MRQLTHGSLFAGIGGFDLGFERAGIKTVWQVEIDPFCRKVLEKHFPDAERFDDIRRCGRHNLRSVDVISGGFPCQDISVAGKRVGIDGERSGLWAEMWRVICELRPGFVVVENVAALLNRGMERVLGDLAAVGFDAEWDVLPACAFGAPHRRERVFLLAYADRNRCDPGSDLEAWAEGQTCSAISASSEQRKDSRRQLAYVVNADCARSPYGSETDTRGELISGRDAISRSSWWDSEPDVGRVAYGVPSRVDRLKGLGNAVVPQIAEWIGRRLVECVQTAPDRVTES